MLIDKLDPKPSTEENHLLSVWLNFVEDGKHGCSKACPFCNFKKDPIYMCPTKGDLRKFLLLYRNYSHSHRLLLSGGGDPLFNFEKNKDKILMILKTCKDLGFSVVMQSGELDTIDKYCDSLLADVVAYYFSSEVKSTKLRTLVKKLREKGKFVVVSKVLNTSNNIADIDFDTFDSWVSFYKNSCSKLLIHENYNHCFTPEENDALLETFEQLNIKLCEKATKEKPCRVEYRPHRYTINKFIGLMNDTVMWGQKFIFINKTRDL